MQWHRSLAVVLLAVVLAAALGGTGWGQTVERILDFNSDILVESDGSIIVTETIQVVCARKQIKRGIFRTLPTRYKDRYGNTVRVDYQIVEVLRDRQPEAYHIREESDQTKVYIGRKNVRLKPGTYTYSLTYKTQRQLGFFPQFDELYWNVTGNDWAFAIKKASARVQLPFGAHVLQHAAYTGRRGQKGHDFTVDEDGTGNIIFNSTRMLLSGEGLTIAVVWPKGFVTEPTAMARMGLLIKDNGETLAGLLGLILLLAYYLGAWLRVGKDPAEGTIIPRFTPPQGMSPGAVRYVTQMGFDHKTLAAAVVNMAVKGCVKISEDAEKSYTLTRVNGDAPDLSKGERQVAQTLLGQAKRIALEQANHARIGEAVKALRKTLQREYEKVYFQLNRAYLIPGALITVGTLAAVVLSSRDVGGAAGLCLWLSIWTAACAFLALQIVNSWKSGQMRSALGMTIFALPFFSGELVGLWLFSKTASSAVTITLVMLMLVNVLFYHWLKAPTRLGRRIMDQIEGFKRYLTTAEQPRLEALNPPAKTPELFEKYLPYALALDVENQWNQQFADVLAAAAIRDRYHPGWYSGHTDLGGLASNFGSSFAGAISSASTAPGSSSGSGGGGSCGGGGGGGGGGGW